MRLTILSGIVICFAFIPAVSGCGGNDGVPGWQAGWKGEVWIYNNLDKTDTDCIYADNNGLITLFWNDGSPAGAQKSIPQGQTHIDNVHFPSFDPSKEFGIQVNFWYWARTPYRDAPIGQDAF